ncbi:MAG TPA: serine/threonine protein kinase [Thiothrix sp.]|nr:serine/threonine protein kinase [Thiothrix sp.]
MSMAVLKANETVELVRTASLHPISLPDWEICALINQNSNAVLYLATNQAGEKAVIKRLGLCTKHLSPHHAQTFSTAVDTKRSMSAAGMVDIFQAGVADDHLYLLMEYLEGGTLASRLANYECYSLQQRLDWFGDIVIALGTMHDLGLVHYDLKPSNIMFRDEDELVLVDCGIENEWLVQAGYQDEGDVYCSPFYVSPECAMGDEYDEQAEIYSLGIIFYELMTGRKPYEASSIIGLIKTHALAPIPRLPKESHCYQTVLNKMLAKHPEDRYTSLDTLLDDLYFTETD